jgi:hypothetical protein
MDFNPAAWGIDPQRLEAAKRVTRRISTEVQVGRGPYRGQFRVFLDAPEGDLEAQELRDQMVERFTSDLADKLYVVFEMKGRKTYVDPGVSSEAGGP